MHRRFHNIVRTISNCHQPERGIATILLLLLIGLTLTVMVLATASNLRQQQSFTLSSHAQTQAKLKGWTGVELVRAYLQQVEQQGKWSELVVGTLTFQGDGITGLIEAELTQINDLERTVTAQITGITAVNSPAESRVLLEVIYSAGGASEPAGNPAAISFSRNLKLGGSINVLVDNASKDSYNIEVLGDVTTGGNSITGVKKIISTGSVRLSSGSTFEEVHANCDVYIDGSVTVLTIKARRNACVYGGAKVPLELTANGSASLQSGVGSNRWVNALVDPKDVDFCRAPGTPEGLNAEAETCPTPVIQGVNLNNGNAGANTVRTAGDVRIESGEIVDLKAMGNLIVTSNATVGAPRQIDGKTVQIKGQVKREVTKPNWNNNIHLKPWEDDSLGIIPVTKVEQTKILFNAYDFREVANYVFSVDSSGNKKVNVRGIQGVTDGTYFLADYDGPHKDKLCTAITGSGNNAKCLEPAASVAKTICVGYSAYNSCFAFDSSTKTWSINGESIAQGIAWFEGNLLVGNGTYYNTFIATENISTSGSTKIYAPNYAGYSGKVYKDGREKTYAPTGICSNSYFSPDVIPGYAAGTAPTFLQGTYPKELCEKAIKQYFPKELEGLGEYALLAGSYKSTEYEGEASYFGGNVTLGSSVELFGNIKSGNEINSGGNTTIHGIITALALGKKFKNNSMGGSTTIDLRDLPSTFTESWQGKPGTPATPGESDGVQLKWSRYL